MAGAGTWMRSLMRLDTSASRPAALTMAMIAPQPTTSFIDGDRQ
jgi:hypothetical protein